MFKPLILWYNHNSKGGIAVNDLKILNIKVNGINVFEDKLNVNFYCKDKVVDDNSVKNVYGTIYTNNIISIVGLNAVGKTTLLKIINLILQIIVNGMGINDVFDDISLLPEKFDYEVVFFFADKFYKVHSYVQKYYEKSELKIEFIEEFIHSTNKSSISSKAKLNEFKETQLDDNNAEITRSKLPNISKLVLKREDSIIGIITKDNTSFCRNMLDSVNLNYLYIKNNSPREILNLFDENIEYLRKNSDDIADLSLKFENSDEVYENKPLLFWNNILSSGTIKGNSMAFSCIPILKTGGYLIVDEIENHLNKQLIRVFIDIFCDNEINKNGATLIFTSHYPELLDFLDRADNIFVITRNEGNKTNTKLLSDLIERNDIKKSDVILSNALKGTAPSYESIQSFKKFIANEVLYGKYEF